MAKGRGREGTFSRYDFISHDGPDENGVRAEVKVVTGFGDVYEVNPSSNGKSSNIIFVVANNKHKLNGWAPVDSDVFKKIQEAEEKDVPINFRIESKRKNNVDRSLPFSKIAYDMESAKESIFKSLAAVKLEDDDEWTISKNALTRFDEDPSADGQHSANDFTYEQLHPQHAENTNTPVASSSFGNPFEAKPWNTYNTDGLINPGAVAVSVPLNVLDFVAKLGKDFEKDGEKTSLTDMRSQVTVTRVIISVMDRLQVSIYADREQKLEKADSSLGSHTRARAIVFDTIRNYLPVPEDLSKESLESWAEELHDKSLSLWKWAIKEVIREEAR